MTDRIKALTVVLEDGVRSDDAEAIINAIRALRLVVSVEPHIGDIDHHAARQQVKQELREKIFDRWYGI